MIRYGWDWKGVYSYHVEMSPWVLVFLAFLIVFFALFFIFTARR